VDAYGIFISSRFANPNIFVIPKTFVLIVWTGNFWYWIGEAGHAKFAMASTSTISGWVMSWRMNSKFEFSTNAEYLNDYL
jgi:hypothetical protein